MFIPEVRPLNKEMMDKAKEKILSLTMPPWALGDLLDLGQKICGITGSLKPRLENKKVFVFASDHGVTEEGISQFPSEVTAQMVYNFVNEGAAINVLSKHAGASTIVVDMGVKSDLRDLVSAEQIVNKKIAKGTNNMAKGPAMSKENALRSLEIGIQMVRDTEMNTDLYAVGEMGIGNTTAASAMISSFLDLAPKTCTGHGTGIDDERLSHKVKIIEQSLSLNKPNCNDPYDVLAKVGGFEIGAMAGMIIGAAHYQRPVLIDGVISTAAALLAYKLSPETKNYMILSHASVEPAHIFAYEHMDLNPLLKLNMRLGEGSGTPLAMNLCEASIKILTEMATFDSAGISGSED